MLAIIAMLLVSLPAQAQAPKASKETMAVANMIDHAVGCVTFFEIMAECLRNRDASDPLITRMKQSSDRTTKIGAQLTEIVGMKPEAWLAKIDYILKRNMERIGNNCLNVSVLFQPYAEPCKRLVENPDAVLKEFLR